MADALTARPARRDALLSALAVVPFAAGYVWSSLVHAARWCKAAFTLGVESGRKRWPHAR